MNPPTWLNFQGAKRVQAEFKALSELANKPNGQIHDLRIVGDNLFQWQFAVKNFDEEQEGGRDLNADLKALARYRGQDHLLMEIRFPHNYPTEPFLLRVVSPRCKWYTGHVTAGGSICIESLTLSGTPGSWQAAFTVESILQVVFLNMIDCDRVWVETRTGPGGLSGPLRVDLQCDYCHDVMAPYSVGEAQAAFHRMMDHHKRNGWGHGVVPIPTPTKKTNTFSSKQDSPCAMEVSPLLPILKSARGAVSSSHAESSQPAARRSSRRKMESVGGDNDNTGVAVKKRRKVAARG